MIMDVFGLVSNALYSFIFLMLLIYPFLIFFIEILFAFMFLFLLFLSTGLQAVSSISVIEI